ncbi:hypothetical protein H5410_031242 [Solanum commersonii]|uniref:Uncharacterized protein n=1 Tax=Solanum commersonii TaxID=4109 RepID=A0A9J5YJM7_SOLCO|nr:hypothetical protein H5410_031242 [Solanum commersonii]
MATDIDHKGNSKTINTNTMKHQSCNFNQLLVKRRHILNENKAQIPTLRIKTRRIRIDEH